MNKNNHDDKYGAARLSRGDVSQGSHYSHVVALIRHMSSVLVVVVSQEADSHEGRNVKKKKKSSSYNFV